MSTFEEKGSFGPSFQFTSLINTDRENIVLLSADAGLPGHAYVTVNDLELSALGTTADLLGQWDYPNPPPGGDPPINLVSWRHIAVTGRDIYVRVTNKGYLFPVGHQAVVVRVAERVMVADPEDTAWADAYLQVQEYIRVLEPVKTYPAFGQPFGTNDWPFSSVKILTTVSPLLDRPYDKTLYPNDNPPLGPATGGSSSRYAQAFLPTSGESPVTWDVVATDLAGNELHLKVPLYFFYAGSTGYSASEFDIGDVGPFVEAYNQAPPGDRQCSGNGAPLQMSPEAGGPAGGTTHPVVMLTLGAASTTSDPNVPTRGFSYPSPPSQSSLGSAAQPAFYPVLSNVQVRLRAADALSRGSFSDSSGDGVGLQFYAPYVVGGLTSSTAPASNRGAVYAQFSDAFSASANAPQLRFPSDSVGGLGCPNGYMLGMSAVAGPVAGDATSTSTSKSSLDTYASSGKPSPSSYFQQLEHTSATALSQFLGGLPLGGIIKEFGVDLPGGAPNITSNLDQATGVLTVTYTMTANLTMWPTSSSPAPYNSLGTIFEPNPAGSGQLKMVATATVAKDGTATYDVNGSIDPFNLYLFGNNPGPYVVFVPFNSMTFSSQNGQKPSVHVALGGVPGPNTNVTFEGALSFVNALEQFLQDLGGSGLSISVTGSELQASFSLSLPPIGVGVFSLSGIGLSAGITIPFLGGPALAQFGFASQENPFTLTVCMFGGGGFFLIGVGFGGIQQIQAEFQFEGQFELDIYVASGGITLAAGVYYSYTAPTTPGEAGTTEISGYVRLTGELSVLGLISISAELDLTLTYQSPNSVAGTASLTVSINLGFFSISPSISVTKQFSGGGDPGGSQAGREVPARAHSGDAAREPLATAPHPVPVKPVLFVDIVPDQSTWGTYIGAFGA